jgi:hypothetical protein
MTPFEQIKADLIWRPSIAGLEVQEPTSVLDVNLSWLSWDEAVKAQDDMAKFATQHMDICRG